MSLVQKLLAFSFYFDNLFTSLNLLTYLKESGYNGTGTVRENRVPKDCRILLSYAVKKFQRGHYVCRSSVDGILIARWNDNSAVTFASTLHSFPCWCCEKVLENGKEVDQNTKPPAHRKNTINSWVVQI
jgi:hypothetical protein